MEAAIPRTDLASKSKAEHGVAVTAQLSPRLQLSPYFSTALCEECGVAGRPLEAIQSCVCIQAKTAGMNQDLPSKKGMAPGGRKSSAERPASSPRICNAA